MCGCVLVGRAKRGYAADVGACDTIRARDDSEDRYGPPEAFEKRSALMRGPCLMIV